MTNDIYMKTALRGLSIFIFAFSLLVSCGPVHRFSRAKKIPREYAFNYCGEEIKAPRTDLNREPWVVYSDRDGNFSYNNPGGKVKAKEVEYLDPFLVIGRKGDFLELVKYGPDVLKNGKLDYKKAEYCGWMHKSKLLLTGQSVTDIASGRKVRMMPLFSGSRFLESPKNYFVADSIRLFRDPALSVSAGTMPLVGLIYCYKYSEDGSSVLVGSKPVLVPGKADEGVMGWVDRTLVKETGVGLHLDVSTLPTNVCRFPPTESPFSKFAPVMRYSVCDSLAALRVGFIMPLFDNEDNFIFNVDGDAITNKQYRDMAAGLEKVNISFVFESGRHTISFFPQMVNALQSIQPLMDEVADGLDLRFNAVLGFGGAPDEGYLVESGFTDDYAVLLDFLTDKVRKKESCVPGMALRRALELVAGDGEATNLIVLVGDTGFVAGNQNDLAARLLNNNCRLMGFQPYGGEGDGYNDFVLDVEALIDSCATGMLTRKRKLLVSPRQVKRVNRFLSVGDGYNGYRLDFPQNSITQGALFFPQKSEVIPMEVLAYNVDSLIRQVKDDNKTITNHLEDAFRSVGNNHTKFDSLFVRAFGLSDSLRPNRVLLSCFPNAMPSWLLRSEVMLLDRSANNKLGYRLLLSESEMEELKEFVASLSEKEVEYIIQSGKEGKKKRRWCNCPEDDWFESKADSVPLSAAGGYVNTAAVRRHLARTYLRRMKYCRVCRVSNDSLEGMTLSEAHFRITGCPSSGILLDSIKIRDLKNKERLPDYLLDELVTYFKKMKNELNKAEPFNTNGQTYYWVDGSLLP